MYLIDGIPCTHGFADHEYPLIRRFMQCLVDIRNNQIFIFNESMHSLTNHTESFLNGFFFGESDAG